MTDFQSTSKEKVHANEQRKQDSDYTHSETKSPGDNRCKPKSPDDGYRSLIEIQEKATDNTAKRDNSEFASDTADGAPIAPVRTTSVSRKISASWHEIFTVKESVKLFFLGDSGVTSPFNRQCLTLMRSGGK